MKKPQIRGKQIRLEKGSEWPRWLQIAEAGLYLGHQAGPFELSDESFQQIISNFKNLPEYQRNPGKEKVVPFDWRHASERTPKSIDAEHAQGWVLDLRMQKSSSGNAQLWALADMSEPARTLIDEEKVRFCSVSVWPDSVDPITGKKIGFYLSSVALTNDPFIRGMVPLSEANATPIAADRYFVDPWDRPQCAGELIEALRRLFGLDALAPLADVLAQLQELKLYATGSVTPPVGVDVGGLLNALRALFNLQTLANPTEIFEATDKLLGAVATAEFDVKLSRKEPRGEQVMTQNELIAWIAARLNCGADPDAIVKGIKLELERSAGTEAKLKALLAAVGNPDPDVALSELKQKLQAAKDLLEAMPELAELVSEKADQEDMAAENDVAQAIAAMRVDPALAADVAKGLFFARTRGVELVRPARSADGKLDLRALLDPVKRAEMFAAFRVRKEAAESFAAKTKRAETADPTPKNPPSPGFKSALFQRFFAEQPHGGSARPGNEAFLFGAGATRGEEPNAVDLSEASGLAGANVIERAKAYLLSRKLIDPNDYDALMAEATRLAEAYRHEEQRRSTRRY